MTNDGLRITRLTHADAGYYTCRAEVNDAGRVKLRDIQLLVNSEYHQIYLSTVMQIISHCLLALQNTAL